MSDLQADVLIRAWEPDLGREGARFAATTVRRDVTLNVASDGPFPEPRTITRPGLIVIAPSAGPGNQNATDVVVRAVPDRIKFTILRTPELVWLPVNAHRDPLMNWNIECIPFTEFIRIRLGDNEAELAARSQNGR